MADGQLNERRIAQIYQNAGYTTYRPETTQYGENDVFGLFDILALEPGHGMRMIQVKSNAAKGIEQWCEDTLPFQRTQGLSPEFAVVYDGQGGHDPTPWRCRLIAPTGGDGHIDLVDEREEDVPAEGDGIENMVAVGHDLEGWYPIGEKWPLWVDNEVKPVPVEYVHVEEKDADGEYTASHYAPGGELISEEGVTTGDVTTILAVNHHKGDPPEWADE